MNQDDDVQSLNSQAQQSESKRSKKSKDGAEKGHKEANENKKKLRVIKEAHRDLKTKYDQAQEQHLLLKDKHAEQEQKMNEQKENNDELKAENAKLSDNILMLQQKITDELGAQMQKADNMFSSEALPVAKRSITLKDVTPTLDVKKTQGQGGGLIKKTGQQIKSPGNLTEEDLRLQEAKEEDELREQMEASNKIAMALVAQENESKQFQDELKQKEDEINSYDEKLQKFQSDYIAKEKEMNHFKQLYEDSYEKFQNVEQRESQIYKIVHQRDQEIENRLQQIDDLNQKLKEKSGEIQTLNKSILKNKDEKLDIETQIDKFNNQEHGLKEDIVHLKDQIVGKDKAIKQLGEVIMNNGKENEKLSEMVTVFKNRIIIENCFQVQFGVQKAGGTSMSIFQIGEDIQMGFIRDQQDQHEFFLSIESSKTKESLRIVVDDIDEIEHVQGTLKFYIHYQKRTQQSLIEGIMGTGKTKKSIKSLFKKKINGDRTQSVPNDPEEDEREECSELFESKFVKNIIESFNTVLELVEQQESELNDWVSDEMQQSQQFQKSQSHPKTNKKNRKF